MDLHEIAAGLGAPDAVLRFRQGVVAAINTDGTVDVTIAASAVVVPHVKAMSSFCPKVGAAVWLATDGRDLFVLGTLAPIGNARARVRRTTDQNVADGTDVTVSFGNPPGDIVDAWGMFSQPSTLVIPAPGIYAIAFHGKFSGNASGYRRASILVNGATVALDNRVSVGGGTPSNVNPTTILQCAQGDAITVEVRQSSGVQLQLSAGGLSDTRLSVAWLGPA